MRPSTLDILDKNLFENYTEIKNSHSDSRFSTYIRSIRIDPFCWSNYFEELSYLSFNWKELKYQDILDKRVRLDELDGLDSIGVYLLIVKPNNLIADCPKYVVYVGIAGEHESERTLRERLKDYFGLPALEKKRRSIHSLLYQYYNNVYIQFSPLSISSADLSKVETSLHGFFLPPMSDRDFPVEIKQQRKSTWS